MSKAKAKKGEVEVEIKKEPVGPAVVVKTDMADDMLAKTIAIVQEAISNNKMEKDMTNAVKSKMDIQFAGASWHVIIGKHYGLALTHETSQFCHFKTQGYNVCMFKSAE